MNEYLMNLMLVNTSFTEKEIAEMDDWEIKEFLGL